ncbi:glycosyltransferase family 28 protein [Dictyocaulus viviparus]|uniref:glucuronosyltransferase n=1 Tax=Dictyocaulus viviparus TaxID=29172 RepID=A0A0D8XRW7_DICVI|nr:glycosyltransferase family 28 protein [Dictyocaulus viviparus]
MIGIEKTVVLSALGVTPYIQYLIGFPENPSYVPGFYASYTDVMTFWERLDNFKQRIEVEYRMSYWRHEMWSLANKARPGFPDLRDLIMKKTGIILMNANEFTETPRPTAHIVRYIGGSTIYSPKPLSKIFNDILDQRKQNVIFSLGSFAESKNMPFWLKNDILKTFTSFPNTTFIWKYENETDNRLSLFITHAGKNSILEALTFGKPIVAIPLFADQIQNANNMKSRGLAEIIDKNELNAKTLTEAIECVLNNNNYTRKAATIKRYLEGRSNVARAEISHWVKLVAEEGVMDHFALHSRNLSFIQYYCLDIIMYLLIQFIIISCLFFYCVKFILKRFLTSRKQKRD